MSAPTAAIGAGRRMISLGFDEHPVPARMTIFLIEGHQWVNGLVGGTMPEECAEGLREEGVILPDELVLATSARRSEV